MTAAAKSKGMVRRYKRQTYEPDDTTYDIQWVDRLTGRIVFDYDGADPANTNPAYGAPTDRECFESRGLDIDEEIPISKAVVPVPEWEVQALKEDKARRKQREREDRNARDLLDFLSDRVWKRFDFERYEDGERTVLRPALESKGFRDVAFYMIEQDSFGPLVRGCVAKDKNGKRVRFVYG
jgi:hypothetical protein